MKVPPRSMLKWKARGPSPGAILGEASAIVAMQEAIGAVLGQAVEGAPAGDVLGLGGQLCRRLDPSRPSASCGHWLESFCG